MKFYKILAVFLAVALALTVYLSSAENLIFNHDFYKNKFSKNMVYDNFANADSISYGVIEFFRGNQKLPDIFTKNEALHLIDVRNLIKSGETLLMILSLLNILLLSFLLFYSKKRLKDLGKLLISSGILMIAPLFFAVIPFNSLFIRFHQIFFPNGNWTFGFDSALIKLFSEQFFYDAFISIITISIIIGIILILLGVYSSKTSSN